MPSPSTRTLWNRGSGCLTEITPRKRVPSGRRPVADVIRGRGIAPYALALVLLW